MPRRPLRTYVGEEEIRSREAFSGMFCAEGREMYSPGAAGETEGRSGGVAGDWCMSVCIRGRHLPGWGPLSGPRRQHGATV
ncbi:unnamed protein product [Boreogadus saida]